MISKELEEYIINSRKNVINVERSAIKPFNRDGINIIVVRITYVGSNGSKTISTEINYDDFLIYLRKKKLNKICNLIN